jgi:hypothetical protein
MKSAPYALTLACVVGLCATQAQATPDPTFGRFLVPAADSTIVKSYYQAAPLTFDRPVFCSTPNGNFNCGTVRFDYATYLGKDESFGGAVLSGGFYLNPSLKLAPGDSLAWVQTVTATIAGDNFWGIPSPAATPGPYTFPDANRTNPRYPFTTLAVTPPDPPGQPTLAFDDIPGRRFSDGNQSWLAELGLVCIDGVVGGVTQAYVIGTLTWGFNVQTGPNRIAVNFPSFTDPFFGSPTAPYLSTLNSYYSGKPPTPPTSGGTSAKFKFQPGCDNCFVPKTPVPEPSGLPMLLIAFLACVALRVHAALRSRPGSRA